MVLGSILKYTFSSLVNISVLHYVELQKSFVLRQIGLVTKSVNDSKICSFVHCDYLEPKAKALRRTHMLCQP